MILIHNQIIHDLFHRIWSIELNDDLIEQLTIYKAHRHHNDAWGMSFDILKERYEREGQFNYGTVYRIDCKGA